MEEEPPRPDPCRPRPELLQSEVQDPLDQAKVKTVLCIRPIWRRKTLKSWQMMSRDFGGPQLSFLLILVTALYFLMTPCQSMMFSSKFMSRMLAVEPPPAFPFASGTVRPFGFRPLVFLRCVDVSLGSVCLSVLLSSIVFILE